MYNVRYELRKILSNRLTIYIFIIGFMVNGFVIAKKPDTIRLNYKTKLVYDDMYAKLSGRVTDEKVAYITEKYKELHIKFVNRSFSKEYNPQLLTGYEAGDYALFKEMYDKYQYIGGYESLLEKVRETSRDNIRYYEVVGNENLKNYNKKVLGLYTQRSDFDFYETKFYKYYLNYDFSNLCVLLVLIVALHSVFSGERETKMNTLLITSKYGKSKAFAGKVLAAIILTLFVTLLFSIEDFVMYTNVMNLRGMQQPIYSIEEMKYCIYDISIVEYIVIQFLIKSVGMVAIASVIMLASAVSETDLYAMIMSILGILPMLIVNKENGIFNAVRLLQITDEVNELNCIPVFGKSVIYVNYTLFSCGILILGCIILSYLLETQYCRVFRRERV